MARVFERRLREYMDRKNMENLDDLVEAMRRENTLPCRFDASYVEWSFRAEGRASVGVDDSYFECLRDALGLTREETFDLIRVFFFGEGPHQL